MTALSPSPPRAPNRNRAGRGRGIHRSNVGGVTRRGLSAHEHVTTIALYRDESERNLRHTGKKLTGLKLGDIDLPSMSIRVLGKGRRERTLPLWKTTAAALRAWLAVRGRVAAPEVFVNARGEPLSRWGFAYLLKQHAATAARAHPGLDKKRISPHVLRHTCAMIILQATQDIRKVSLWLGHATLTTTEIYTRGDPTEKLDAMESIVPPHLRRGAFQPSDKLIALLKRPS